MKALSSISLTWGFVMRNKVNISHLIYRNLNTDRIDQRKCLSREFIS